MVLLASASRKIRHQWIQGLPNTHSFVEVVDHTLLLQSAADCKPSIILLDHELPGLDGINGIMVVRRFFPSARIIFFADNLDDGEIISALKVGASGYYHRDIDSRLLARAIDVIQKGEVWVERRIINALLAELTSLVSANHPGTTVWNLMQGHMERLTPRELQVAQMVGAGASNKQIAFTMNITERTVKAHLASIFRKFNFSDRVQLALAMTHRNLSHL
ncbi:MAG: Transcriptional regulatory protein DegU [Syntrophorhabdus sp. PtaU1.Bin153]|nr:MAG: Transcriptional regulatory protein DegU [Syntrophorhabdus sp. PtaU1.Bin153]